MKPLTEVAAIVIAAQDALGLAGIGNTAGASKILARIVGTLPEECPISKVVDFAKSIRTGRREESRDIELYHALTSAALRLAYTLECPELCGQCEVETACGIYWIEGKANGAEFLQGWMADPRAEESVSAGLRAYREDPDLQAILPNDLALAA